ncbi:MAG: family 78 glycoside hydrolase catalytic domain [Clostridia bacterium]|nr:family 78 glycoside hydrolase catalytic domain [Clostridia bacterium]
MARIHLLVNGLHSPLGILKSTVEFSWKYIDVNSHQTLYRIQVSSKKNFEEILYDSGDVSSAQHLYVSVPSDSFPALKALYARVSVTLEDGSMLSSEPTEFSVSDGRWNANWIWKDHSVRVNDYAAFQKKFNVDALPAFAHIYVSAHHNYKLSVNGTQISGFVSPAPSNPENDKLFLSYNVLPILKRGENEIRATVLYEGGHGQNYIDLRPGFWLEMHFGSADCDEILYTDDQWLCSSDTPYMPDMPYQQRRNITPMEHFDARLSENAPVWKNAVVVDPICDNRFMFLQKVSEGVVERAITPALISSDKGAYIFDAGCLITGWVHLTVNEPRGTEIAVRYSENLNEEDRVGHNVANEPSETYLDKYTCMGVPGESWRPCFSFKAFRYFEVTGNTSPILPENVICEVAHTDLSETGCFESDNEVLNKIYKACIQTQKNNAMGQLVDCPHREQAQYLADADLQAETLLYVFDEAHLAEKVLRDFTEGQFADGTFPFSYPANTGLEKISKPIPEWDFYFPTLLWKLYYLTGREGYLKTYFEPARRMLDYFLSKRTQDGLVEKTQNRHISDHPFPAVDQSGTYLAAQNMKISNDARILSRIARILGDQASAIKYEKLADDVRAAVRKNLLDDDTKLFADSTGSNLRNRGINAMALNYSMFDECERSHAAEYVKDAAWDTSIVLTLEVLRALFESGNSETAYSILSSEEAPGWGVMVKNGGTVWESFLDKASHSHAWTGYPARLFLEYLVGIKAVKPGFVQAMIKPFFPKDMRFMKGAVNTPEGAMRVCWKWDDHAISLEAEIPYGVTADVFLPDENMEYKKVCTIGCGKHSMTFQK